MRITLFDKNHDICRKWEDDFSDIKDITVRYSDFLELPPHQCIASPGSSFGMMDGDFDMSLRNYFGDKIQRAVKKRIDRKYGGIQPVGTALVFRTGDSTFPYLAHTPTHLYPGNTESHISVFIAFRALLIECYKEGIDTLACCSLGHEGIHSAQDISLQMKTAYTTMNMNFNDWQAVNRIRVILGELNMDEQLV